MRTGRVLAGLVLGIVVTVLVCANLAGATSYSEAPMLQERVAAGELPPVEQRLPRDPKVEEPLNEIGRYGGTMNRVFTGMDDGFNYVKVVGGALARVTSDGRWEPDLLSNWTYSQDGTVLTLEFRRGVKWSDGVEMTADDFMFTVQDLMLDPNAPTPPARTYLYDAAGNTATVTKVDDYTVELHYEVANTLGYLDFRYEVLLYPKHYLMQFHPRYNPGSSYVALDEAISYDRITEAIVDLPTLGAWMAVEYTPGQQLVMERNPYFWKVDTAGNQLPYIDRIVFHIARDPETIPLMAAAGQVDLQARHIRFTDFEAYKANESQGNYITQLLDAEELGPGIKFTWDHKDPVMRNVIRNDDFRRALSLAINRQAISDALYFGLAQPTGYSPIPTAPQYPGDEARMAYAQHDPAEANRLLNSLGLYDTNGDGIRELPDGRPLEVVVDTPQAESTSISIIEMIQPMWREVGVELVLRSTSVDALWPRLRAGEFTAYSWKIDSAGNIFLKSEPWFPAQILDAQMYRSAAEWYLSGGDQGEAPVPWVHEVLDLYQNALLTGDSDEQAELGAGMARLIAEHVYQIATVIEPRIAIASRDLGNLPETWTVGDTLRDEGAIRPWQLYFTEPRK